MSLSEERLTRQVVEAATRLVEELDAALRTTGNSSAPHESRCRVAAAMDACLERLSQTGTWGPPNQVPSSHLWRIAGRWLERGDLQRRARFKPRGYAGDFELLDDICARRVATERVGRTFDQYFQDQAAPQAVRNRTELVADAIVARCVATNRTVKVVSFGSGPAADLRQAVATLNPESRCRVQLLLLDLDERALGFARGQLLEYLDPSQVDCRRDNLFRLAKRPPALAPLAEADLISVPGIFDYFDDQTAAAAIGGLRRQLAGSGELLVFNFSTHNPSRAYMEWVGNWSLRYRSRDQLLELARTAGLNFREFRVDAESEGVNLYLHAGDRVNV